MRFPVIGTFGRERGFGATRQEVFKAHKVIESRRKYHDRSMCLRTLLGTRSLGASCNAHPFGSKAMPPTALAVNDSAVRYGCPLAVRLVLRRAMAGPTVASQTKNE